MGTTNNPKGRERATSGTVRILVRMPAELADWVDRCAEQDGRSRDAWVRRALEAAIGRQKAGTREEAVACSDPAGHRFGGYDTACLNEGCKHRYRLPAEP